MPKQAELGEDQELKQRRLDPDGLLARVTAWQSESEQDLAQYHNRWAENMKLLKGRPEDHESEKSKVRNRSKIFFRKVWASVWRILASMYNAFLRDPESVKIEGRGPEDVRDKAEVLQYMVDYRRDKMMNQQSLFLKHLWAIKDILDLGHATALLCWEYDDEKDGPELYLYPPEQVFPDMKADLPEHMEYIILESYETMDKLKEEGYQNLDEAETTGEPSNVVRSTRWLGKLDPLQNPGPNEYPQMGRYQEGENKKVARGRYKVWKIFYRENGKAKYCVTNGTKVILKYPEDSAYGKMFPVVMGQCLTETHKLIGEGFPEPMEGPQKSYNHLLNVRKDNIHLALNKQTIVDRYANVDLQSLMNSRPGGTTLADRTDAVIEREMGDVTQSAYVEARMDAQMMDELSGVTPGKLGMENAAKTGVAQINQEESDAKIDLFIAIVAHTWFKRFYTLLAYMIQRFETDEQIFRVANQKLRQRRKLPYGQFKDIYEVDDFEADVIIEVGPGTVGRERDIRQTILFMDRAIMANQASAALLTSGGVPQGGVLRFFDVTKIMEPLLKKIGYKNVEDYFFNVAPPPPEQDPSVVTPERAAAAGALTPQAAGAPTNSQNMLQAGGLGGR